MAATATSPPVRDFMKRRLITRIDPSNPRFRRHTMRLKLVLAATALAAAALPLAAPAEAKGCIRGAAAGAVAGHMAGHHAVLGAMAGCAVVHHHYARKAKVQHH
jgi:hypothetical protein